MTAEILSVGTELLLGNIINTNAAFLSQKLAELGVFVYHQATVGDNKGRLFCALKEAFDRADMVVISGGLGPTLDDITKDVAAEFFGVPLVMHDESMARIRARFARHNLPPDTERNALVLDGAIIFPNDNGCAPGIASGKKNKTLILLPGPPHEMEPMFTNYVSPYLMQQKGEALVSKTLKIIGIGESVVENKLLDLIESQTNPTIAPYAKLGEVHLRLTAVAQTEEEAGALITPLQEEICNRLHPHVYSSDGSNLPEVIVRLLKEKGLTLAIAESCTGGLVAAEIVSVDGCSEVFLQGLCTYSNEAKINRLGVPAKTIVTFGAVSEETAAAMAEGVAKTSGTDIGLATTGIAGPGGGTPDKPVGLVYVAVAINGQTITSKCNLIGNRNEVRKRATKIALDMLRRVIK